MKVSHKRDHSSAPPEEQYTNAAAEQELIDRQNMRITPDDAALQQELATMAEMAVHEQQKAEQSQPKAIMGKFTQMAVEQGLGPEKSASFVDKIGGNQAQNNERDASSYYGKMGSFASSVAAEKGRGQGMAQSLAA